MPRLSHPGLKIEHRQPHFHSFDLLRFKRNERLLRWMDLNACAKSVNSGLIYYIDVLRVSQLSLFNHFLNKFHLITCNRVKF